jgi:23S rRNA (cytosine1962-C5)-methyltransferase
MHPTIDLPHSIERSLASGHPWVYRDHVPHHFSAPTGAWVRIRSGRFTAYALWDETSPLALRVYSTKGVPDSDWLRDRVQAAWSLRAPLRARGDTDAYRWLNGEGDGLPGIVVDLYGAYAVLAADTGAVDALVEPLVSALVSRTDLSGVVRLHRDRDAERLELLHGSLPPDEIIVTESGLMFVVSLARGQKTGFFLDQRENRRMVEALASGRRVLNLFSYTGGFSLYAARGGATEITSVDIARGAMEAAQASFARSGISAEGHRFVVADVFDFLGREQASGRKYDLVVCDPPSFARSQKQASKAERAYVRVNAAALGLVAEDGLLVSASCTSRVTPAAFVACLADAAWQSGRRLQIVHEAGHALDHPFLAGHAEGRYLKCVVGRVSGRV